MTADFFDRFATPAGAETPLGLQLLYPEPPDFDADAVATVLRDYHPDLAAATVELLAVADHPAAAKLVSADGPPASALGLLSWGKHVVKLVAFNAPMPYGPVETCVVPALMPPELKEEARRHGAHILLFYAGSDAVPVERYVALAAVAGALARFGASVVLNEEARAAVPAYDLVPDPEEDALRTLRNLPVPYLWGGFVRMDAGDSQRLWVRTFANHRLGLPNLAYHTTAPGEVRRVFELFAGMLGYLKQMGETFTAGDTIDLGDGVKLRVREPADAEWYLDSDGPMLIVEPFQG